MEPATLVIVAISIIIIAVIALNVSKKNKK